MNEQLSIFSLLETAREQTAREQSVLEQTAREQNFLTPSNSKSCSLAPKSCSLARQTKDSGWVEVYSPSKRKGHQYYRYVYVVSGRPIHTHIRGGNINSPAAQRLKAVVEEAIALEWSPLQIVELLTS